jgi:peptide/nickel transport system substrate-binding protein
LKTLSYINIAICTLLLSALACTSTEKGSHATAVRGGTLVISASADADILIPQLTMSVQGKQVGDQIFDNLADIGESMNTVGDAGFRPRLARTWKWAPDSSFIDFTIDSAARWHDGERVRSSDVRFTFGLTRDPNFGSQLAPTLEDVDSVTTPDTLTARVWVRHHPPSIFFRLAGVAILPEHLLSRIAPKDVRTSPFARAPIGSGRFRFSEWKPSQTITLVEDSANYRGRPSSDRVVWLVSPDYDAAALRFLSGQSDFLDLVKPELLQKVVTSGKSIVTGIPGLSYGYVAFNFHDGPSARPHPVFSDRNVRRALVMSVDRKALVKNVFDTLAIVGRGPFTRAIATSDTASGLPYDTVAAGKILDDAGWKRSASGIRRKGSTPLHFTLLVPSSSAIRMKFAVLLQEQWKRAGADVAIEPLELSTFGERLEGHKFDALLNAWQIDPDPASVRDEWMSEDRRKDGFNFASYSNRQFDAAVDSAANAANPATSTVQYRRAYRILTDDAAALWLYESKNVFGVSKRIEPVGMRPDAWWAGLPDWRVVEKTAR